MTTIVVTLMRMHSSGRDCWCSCPASTSQMYAWWNTSQGESVARDSINMFGVLICPLQLTLTISSETPSGTRYQ